MGKKLKVGIIGCGDISVSHAEGISKSDGAVVGMTMDTNLSLAKDLGEKYGVAYTDKLDEVLKSDIDTVYIAVPHFLHAPITIKAAEAGKHVMVEKPISTNLEDAKKMIEVCKKNKIKFSVCFVMRYRNLVVKAKELIDKKVIGDIISVLIYTLGKKEKSYWTGGYSGRAKTDWRKSKEKSGGGILIMNASHNIDHMRYITGLEVTKAYSEYDTFDTDVEVEDTIAALLRFSNGAIGSINSSSSYCGSGDGPGIADERIYGKEGQIVLSNPLQVYTTKKVEGLEPDKWNQVSLGQPQEGSELRRKYVNEFAEAVFTDKEVPVTGEDGLKCLDIVTKIYKNGNIKSIRT
jgi:predicted dehydrogenase